MKQSVSPDGGQIPFDPDIILGKEIAGRSVQRDMENLREQKNDENRIKKEAHNLQTEDLAVGYGKKIVLSDISLQIMPGEILTLVGPNGSGKSTILKTITGELKAIDGNVLLLGKDSTELSGTETAKILSMVMTTRPRPEYMTCREVVGTGRYPYVGRLGILGKKDWEIVDTCMDTVCATEVADQDFYRVSDGQRQRVMLARALCQEPEILVLDEPTSYLDVRYKLDILWRIRRLCGERRIAVIMSLHELDLALKISDRIACADGERITICASPEELMRGEELQKLFQVSREAFRPLTGTLYFEVPEAGQQRDPEIFVIGGGGAGLPVYYRLLREGVPFAAGILLGNDVEMDAARACATSVIWAQPFRQIGENEFQRAKEMIDECKTVVCPLTDFGPLNEYNKRLKEYADSQGKLKNE